MASPWNQHCANCISTLSFPIGAVSSAFSLSREFVHPRGTRHLGYTHPKLCSFGHMAPAKFKQDHHRVICESLWPYDRPVIGDLVDGLVPDGWGRLILMYSQSTPRSTQPGERLMNIGPLHPTWRHIIDTETKRMKKKKKKKKKKRKNKICKHFTGQIVFFSLAVDGVWMSVIQLI